MVVAVSEMGKLRRNRVFRVEGIGVDELGTH
jgi:hypothetical protein